MAMPMMQVGQMRVLMREGRMCMNMAMRFRPFLSGMRMIMIMMLIMAMRMFVGHGGMNVKVLVGFS